MGMNHILPQDKDLVVERLAQGESYSQAIEGTSIKSKDTVHRIAETQSNAIERKRRQFLKKIKQSGAGDAKRATMWAKMVYATKSIGKDAVEAPDWQARATALKYIDSLDNLDKAEEMKLEVTDTTPERTIDPDSQEAQNFNNLFKKFIKQM